MSDNLINNGGGSAEGVLRVVPLGGLGEVGKNMMFIEYESAESHDSIIIDAGIMFPENDMLGIDMIIPDFNYIMDKLDTVRGVIITHGHEDHTGAIGHVMQHVKAPIYATPLTLGLLEIKLKNAGLLNELTLFTTQAGDTIKIGPFLVEFFHNCHSIPDSVGLGITTPVGLIVHTGDYKFDHTPVDSWPPDFSKLAELGQRGVLAMFGDSTNSNVKGWTPSESVIDAAFDEVFRDAPGRIIIATFASLISRIQQVANTARTHNRKMVVMGYSMVENVKMARRLGYLDIPDAMLVDISEANKMAKNRVVILTTGTQGEPLAGLGRLSTGRHRHLEVETDDTIVMSSHPIPGNEEMVSRTINKLIQRGANVVYDPIKSVHVSGHAAQEEIKLMINLVKPEFLVPVHGELRHLSLHARIGESLGIPKENIAVVENGTILTFTAETMEVGERVPGGYIFVDGSGVGDIGPIVLRDREILGRDGFVIANVMLDERNRLAEDVEFVSRGFVYLREAQELLDGAQVSVRDKLSSKDIGKTDKSIDEVLEKTLERYFYNETKRRPMIFVFVYEI